MGQQLLVGHTLRSPQKIPRGAMLKQIAWKITLLSPPPTGLEIKLCNQHQCLSLPSLTGHLMLKHAMSPSGDFRFIYFVNRQGQLRPPLNVVSNQLTISYR
ncbi:MAG: flagellar protein FlhE [Enterobacteriaceae bacterium]|nr:flagellar protein FlhE [Enterobacteriaceae bacterium]